MRRQLVVVIAALGLTAIPLTSAFAQQLPYVPQYGPAYGVYMPVPAHSMAAYQGQIQRLDSIPQANDVASASYQGEGQPTAAEDSVLRRLAAVESELATQRPYSETEESNSDVNLENRIDAIEAALATQNNDGGEWKRVGMKKWNHKVGGRAMADWVNFADQTAAGGQNYFEFRSLRLAVEGTGYGVYDYRFEVDFAPEDIDNPALVPGAVEMKDMYVGIKDVPYLGHIRFGNFRAPFGLENQTRLENTTFMERGLPDVYSPGREVGIAAYNNSADKRFGWAGGFFFDGINDLNKGRVDNTQGFTFAGRAFYVPVYDEPSDGRYAVHTGLSFRWTNDQDESILFATRPEVHNGVANTTFFTTGAVPGSDYSVVDGEIAIVNGAFSVQSELMWTNVEGSDNLYGAYVYASYFLTGENRNYNRTMGRFDRLKPFENFWMVPGCHGRGAWEAAIRYSYLDAKAINQGTLQDLTVGLNWYLTPHTRVMFEWIHPYANGWAPPEPEADILGMRAQWDF